MIHDLVQDRDSVQSLVLSVFRYGSTTNGWWSINLIKKLIKEKDFLRFLNNKRTIITFKGTFSQFLKTPRKRRLMVEYIKGYTFTSIAQRFLINPLNLIRHEHWHLTSRIGSVLFVHHSQKPWSLRTQVIPSSNFSLKPRLGFFITRPGPPYKGLCS